jgi:hypothetical protein
LSNSLVISGTTGTLVSLAVNTTTLYFQMGDDYNTGITSLDFATAAATPVPPALLLFLTAIGGVGLAGWRKGWKVGLKHFGMTRSGLHPNAVFSGPPFGRKQG